MKAAALQTVNEVSVMAFPQQLVQPFAPLIKLKCAAVVESDSRGKKLDLK